MKMNKLAVVVAGLSACLFTACAGVPPASGIASQPAQAAEGPQSSSAAGSLSMPEAMPLPDGGVMYQNIFLEPGAAMKPVYEALGEPVEYSEVISCLFEGGMDKTYFYDGVSIYTYPTEAEERILYIELTSDTVTTSRSVRLGDSLDSALLLYNGELSPDGESRYTAVFGPVLFSLTAADGKINSVGYELAEMPDPIV